MNQTEISVATHDKEDRLYRISSKIPANKQQMATTNPGKEEESNFQSCHIYYFKRLILIEKLFSTKKIVRHAEKHLSHT